MTPLFAWLPTIVAVITAALALGGANNKLGSISAKLEEMRGEYKNLVAQVQEALTAKAVTQIQVEGLRVEIEALKAGRIVDAELRHEIRTEFNARILQLEAMIVSVSGSTSSREGIPKPKTR